MVHSQCFESQPVARQGLEFVADRVFYGGYHPDGVDDPPGRRFQLLQIKLAGTRTIEDDRERGYAVCAIRGPGERDQRCVHSSE